MTLAVDTHALVYQLIGQRRRLGAKARAVFTRVERGQDILLVPFTKLKKLCCSRKRGSSAFDCLSGNC